MAIFTVGNVVAGDPLPAGNLVEGNGDTNAQNSGVPTTDIAAKIPKVQTAVVGNLAAWATGGVLVDSGGSGGGGSGSTLEFQISGKYFSNQEVVATDVPVPIKFDTSNQASANVTLTGESELTFITVGVYWVNLYTYASMNNNNQAFTGAIYSEIVSGAADIDFLEGIETGLAGQANQGRVIDKSMPIKINSANTVIRFNFSQRNGNTANTKFTLKTFAAGAIETPAVPSASVEIWKESVSSGAGGFVWQEEAFWENYDNQLPLYNGAESAPYAWDVGVSQSDDLSNPLVSLTLDSKTTSTNPLAYSNLITFNAGSDGKWRFKGSFNAYIGTSSNNSFLIQLFKFGETEPLDYRMVQNNNSPQSRGGIVFNFDVSVTAGDQYYFNAAQSGGNNATQMNLQAVAYTPASGVYGIPSASLRLERQVDTISNSIAVIGSFPFGLANPTPIVIDDNDYYTLEWVGEYLAAPLGWWRFVPKAAMDGLTVSGFFTLQRPARTPNTFTLVAATGVDIWINNNNTVAPPGGTGRYNSVDENKLSGYLSVQDTTPFFRNYALNATEDVLVMYQYLKSV